MRAKEFMARRMESLAPAVMPAVNPINPRWQCITCEEPATLMHKGTTYCRPCYVSAARIGGLIG